MRVLDQMGNVVTISQGPHRIVSLVPSQTELLFDLGLGDKVVGITKFCIHPADWHRSKRIIGGTKKFHFDVIDELKPDLIIGNKEENYKEGILTLKEKYPVWMSDIVTIGDAINMIRSVSALTNSKQRGVEIIGSIHQSFKKLKILPAIRTLYLIWRDPWMGAGNKTFIHSLMEMAGLKNVLISDDRYPKLSIDDIQQLNPEVVMLSSEPFPFSAKHIDEVRDILPQAKIMLVDGEIFSWYGSRLTRVGDYINSLQLSTTQ